MSINIRTIKKMGNLILCFFFCFYFWSCDRSQEGKKADAGNTERVEAPLMEERPKSNPPIVTLEEKLREMSMALHKSYRILVYYNFLDTPHHQRFGHFFEYRLYDFLGKNKRAFSITFSQERECAEKLVYAKNLHKDLGSSFFEKAKGQEIALALCVSMAEKKIQMRSLHFLNARISPVMTLEFSSTENAIEMLCQNFFVLLGLEGYIIASEGKKVTIAFRSLHGNARARIQEGSYFWVFNQEKLWRDSLVYLEKVSQGEVLLGYGEFLGQRLPQDGLNIKQIYFPGSSQKFQLVNLQGEPQSGFSIFISQDGFSSHLENYLCTTDFSGEFVCQDHKKKPLYLVVAKNVEGVTFDFIKKLLVVQGNDSIEKIQVQDWQTLKENAQNILSEDAKVEKKENLRILVNMRLEQVKEYIANKELNKALVALKLARQHCDEIEGKEKLPLCAMLDSVQKIYEEALFKTKVKEEFISACKLMEEAEECIGKIDYEKTRNLLLQAEKIWPKNFYEQEYKELQEKKKRLQQLEKELSEPSGKARIYIINKLFFLKPEEVDSSTLAIAEEHIKNLFEKGELDRNKKYNDYELFLKLRIFLNDLSQKLAQLSQKYLISYQKASTEKEKSSFFEKHKASYDASQIIDKWLKKFKI